MTRIVTVKFIPLEMVAPAGQQPNTLNPDLVK